MSQSVEALLARLRSATALRGLGWLEAHVAAAESPSDEGTSAPVQAPGAAQSGAHAAGTAAPCEPLQGPSGLCG